MILRRIQIEGYKALRNPVELKDLGLGIHLIHGPNEIGKSTLMAAVARALFDRYNSSDQEIRALRPWGTELAPRVTLELESGGKRFRVEKKFLDEESSSLSEWNGSKYERISDSVKADDKVRSFMLGSAPKSGASSLGNWGLARLLWMTQLPTRMEAPHLDESLRQHLLGVLGSAVLSDGEQRFIAKLDKAYDVYYTAAKQSEKKGSPLQEARERLEKAEENLLLWKPRWDEVSRLNETALDSQSRLAAAEIERSQLDTQIKELRVKAKEELELENLLKVKDQGLLVFLGKWKALNSGHLEIQSLDQAVAKHQTAVTTLEPRIREQELTLAQLEAETATVAEKIRQVTAEAGVLSREMAQAALLSDARALVAQAGTLGILAEQVSRLEQEHQSRQAAYASRKRPEEADVTGLRTALAESETLRARITDLGIEVRVVSERDGLTLQWKTADGAPMDSVTDGGRDLIFKSADQGELVIPGVGRIVIRSGAQDSRVMKERLAALEGVTRDRLAAFAVSTLEELQALLAATAELVSEGRAARAALASALGTRFKNAAEVSVEYARVESELKRQLGLLGLSVQELAARAGESGLRELQEKILPAKRAQEDAQRTKDLLDTQLRAARGGLEETRKGFDQARQSVELLGRQLDARLSALGGRNTLAREIAEAALEKTGLESELAALGSRLPAAEARASLRLQALERARDEARKREDQVRAEMLQAAVLLTSAEGQGYYSKLAAAEEESALAAELVAQRQTQAQGTKLLRALAHAKRERMNDGLLSPIEGAVVEIFNFVRGSGRTSPARLAFGTDLHELGVRLPDAGATERMNMESLSLGTQEQAMFAIRLAFGELLATRGEKPEPQLVVLDDPLVNADPERQERAREILRRAGEKLQILILTARPDDYKSLTTKQYDLAALKS